MGAYLEAFLLFIVIFFSQTVFGLLSGRSFEGASFSISALIFSIFIYSIPSLAVIWYLLYRKKKAEFRLVKPQKNDLLSGFIAFPALIITGITVSFISALTGGVSAEAPIPSPASAAGWITLVIFCLLSAYLEESFFRFYLLSKKEELKLTTPLALIISSVLFGLCHIHDGLFGFLNALLAGLLLGSIFLKYRTIHGIAIAHGLYNITAFILYAML